MKLVVGIILIFMSIVHVIYGEKMQVNILKKLEANNILIGSFRVMSLQGGLLLFAVGVIEIMVYAGLSGFAVYIPLGIVCLNVISVFIVAIVKHQELFKVIIPQFLIFSIIIILQVLSVI